MTDKARKVLVQYGQGVVAAVGDLEKLLRCSNIVGFMGLCTTASYFGLSIAGCSHELWLMLKAFSGTLRVSLKRFFWPPRECLPYWSSLNKSFSVSQTGAVEVVHFPGIALVDRPRLTSMEQSGEHYRFLDLYLCHRGSACSVPHILVESAKGSNCLGESGVNLVVDDNCAGKCSAKIHELVHYIESLSIDGDVGFNVGLLWSGLGHHLSLLVADGEPKIVAGLRELVNTVLHVRSGGSVESTIISKL